MDRQLPLPGRRSLFAAIGPTVLVFSFVFVFPLVFSIRYSLFNWSGGATETFVGLGNYAAFFRDASFWASCLNTVFITAIIVIGQVGIGLVVSVMLTLSFVRLVGFHRTTIFLPVVISPIVVGLIWSMIYNSRKGMLNLLLRSIGFTKLPLWLDDPSIVLLSVSVPVIWQYIGLYMVMFLGALQSIPKEIIESARLDGANGAQTMARIMLPMIYPTFKVGVMLCVSGTLKIFDHIFVLTNGGPGEASMTMSLYNYNVSFNMMRFSYGSTVSIGMIVITLLITLATMRSLGGKQYE
jgi:raffinose/stachyose/melibiose transport system permease protein